MPPDEKLRDHYLAERALADRLRNAPAAERPRLYAEVYEEFYRRFPDAAIEPDTPYVRRYREGEIRFLRRFLKPGDTLVEAGCGDAAVGRALAPEAGRVVAVDARDSIPRDAALPTNFEFLKESAVSPSLPPASADIVYSDQFLEHLHPDDARAHARSARRALKDGGLYVCITPHRFAGPHDVSEHFDDEARGFHLKEYTASELRRLFREASFARVRFYGGVKCRYFRLPAWLLLGLERLLAPLPPRPRRRAARSALLRPFVMNVRAVAEAPSA